MPSFTHFFKAECLPKLTNSTLYLSSVFLPPHQFEHGKVLQKKCQNVSKTSKKKSDFLAIIN